VSNLLEENWKNTKGVQPQLRTSTKTRLGKNLWATDKSILKLSRNCWASRIDHGQATLTSKTFKKGELYAIFAERVGWPDAQLWTRYGHLPLKMIGWWLYQWTYESANDSNNCHHKHKRTWKTWHKSLLFIKKLKQDFLVKTDVVGRDLQEEENGTRRCHYVSVVNYNQR